jgi:uncharacterized protein YaeQ
MALSATVYHLEIDLSDVDRGVYEKLDLRLALHPSETLEALVTRAIAYCLSYQEGIAFSHGLSATDEPAVWVKDLQGNLALWLDIGSPSAERLHKASKAARRVVVFTHHSPEVLLKQLSGQKIHRREELEMWALPGRFVEAVASAIGRNTRVSLVRNEDELYVTIDEQNITGKIERHTLL